MAIKSCSQDQAFNVNSVPVYITLDLCVKTILISQCGICKTMMSQAQIGPVWLRCRCAKTD